ncbi:MAG: drug/metabolite exporter YedA [Sandaracinus sp.]
MSTAPASPSRASRVDPWLLASLAAVYLIWSTTYLAIRVAVQTLPPFLTAGVRYLAAGSVLMGIARIRGEKLPPARAWAASAVVALLFFVVGNGFVAVASVQIGSGVVAVVCATMPLWGAVMMPLVGERVSAREWVGLGVGFLGVVVLALGGDLHADATSAGLLLLAPIGWALGSVLVRKLAVGKGVMGSAMQMVSGGALTLVVSRLRGEPIPDHVAPEAALAVIYLASLGSLVGITAYNYLLVHARPALAMSYAYVNPVLAVVIGAWVGHETISYRVGLAILLILPAVFAIVARPRGDGAKPPVVTSRVET